MASKHGWSLLAPQVDIWPPRILLKSPPLIAGVGTVSVAFLGPFRRRKPWYQPKKKVLSLIMGPPPVTPNSFCLLIARGALPVLGSGATSLAKNPFASSFSLRRNS